jgi:hypothetical protein
MSTSVSSVQGNQSFTKVISLASQLSELNVSDAKVSTLTANTVNTGMLKANNVVSTSLSGTPHCVTLYTPTEFIGISSGFDLWLLTTAGQANPTTGTDPLIYKLPVGAQVVSANVVASSTLTSVNNVNIGTALGSGNNPPSGIYNNIANTMLLTSMQAIGGSNVGQVPLGLGTAGSLALSAPFTPAIVNTGVSISPITTPTGSGNIAVNLCYIV